VNLTRWETSKPVLALWLVAAIVLIEPSSTFAQKTTNQETRSKLWKQDRDRLALAIAKGQHQVRLLIASSPGRNQEVAGFVKELGGSVEYDADEIGYLRVRMPVDGVERITTSPSVQAITLSGTAAYRFPYDIQQEGPTLFRQNSEKLRAAPVPPGSTTAAENPYLATQNMGSPQFIAKHPTFDGRGVTVGVVELMPDFLISELQTAKSLKGDSEPKIAGVADVLEPEDEASPSSGCPIVETRKVSAIASQFTEGGLAYWTPADGAYRFGFFDSQHVARIAKAGKWKNLFLYEDVNSEPRPIAVLWDEVSGRVWVDTNQNRDFGDEKAMRDYNAGADVGVFGDDDPATPWRESLGFVIIISSLHHTLRIEAGSFGHTTATAILAVGKGLFGGRVNGAAPEARLLPVFGIRRDYGLIEGTLLLMRKPEVDVLWSSMGSTLTLSEGESTIPLLWSRIVTRYKKLIFHGVGNFGPGSLTINDIPSAKYSIAVGGYTDSNTWWSNFGMIAPQKDYVVNLSARGPAANGAFKPDLLAPVSQVVPIGVYYPEQMSPAGYKLPSGYGLASGTSSAGPMAAGAAALLISAAKQSGVRYDADRLRWAIESSARYLEGRGPHEQGAGLINVEAAWELLKRAAEPVVIISRGPVKSMYSRYLRRPNEGPGIYEREGWEAGQSGKRVITFTRRSGGTGSRLYRLAWRGNDGTFAASKTTIALPLNQDVSLSVRINPHTIGIHSATLNLLEERTGFAVYRLMTTVVAAEKLSAATGFRLEHEASVEPLRYTSWFVRVPEGASELKLESPNVTGGVTIRAMPPWGVITALVAQPEGAWQSAIGNPAAGVWEIVIEQKNREVLRDDNGNIQKMGVVGDAYWLETRMELQSRISIHLKATAIRIENTGFAARKVLAEASATNNQVTFLNRYGELNRVQTRSALGAMETETVTLTAGNLGRRREIEVEPGTSSLQVSVREVRDTVSDVDLYLYDCTNERHDCEFKKSSAGAGAYETIRIDNPPAGKWLLVIDPYDLPNGNGTFEYKEITTNPLFGTVAVTPAPASLAPGQQWKAEVTSDVKTLPTGRRRLCVVVSVVDQATFEYRKSHLSPSQVPRAPGILTTVVVPLDAHAGPTAEPK
jgi:Subtilase family